MHAGVCVCGWVCCVWVWVHFVCVSRVQITSFSFHSGIRDQLGVGRWLPYGFYFLKLYGFRKRYHVCAFCVFSVQSSQTSVQFSFGILIK